MPVVLGTLPAKVIVVVAACQSHTGDVGFGEIIEGPLRHGRNAACRNNVKFAARHERLANVYPSHILRDRIGIEEHWGCRAEDAGEVPAVDGWVGTVSVLSTAPVAADGPHSRRRRTPIGS